MKEWEVIYNKNCFAEVVEKSGYTGDWPDTYPCVVCYRASMSTNTRLDIIQSGTVQVFRDYIREDEYIKLLKEWPLLKHKHDFKNNLIQANSIINNIKEEKKKREVIENERKNIDSNIIKIMEFIRDQYFADKDNIALSSLVTKLNLSFKYLSDEEIANYIAKSLNLKVDKVYSEMYFVVS